MEKQLARATVEKEIDHERRVLFERIMTDHGADYSNLSGPPQNNAARDAYKQYDAEVAVLNESSDKRIANTIAGFERENANRRLMQSAISINLSRLSPVSSFAFIVTELSGTGILELDRFQEQAWRFQEQVKADVYDQFVTKSYGNTSGNTSTSTSSINDYEPSKVPVPISPRINIHRQSPS